MPQRAAAAAEEEGGDGRDAAVRDGRLRRHQNVGLESRGMCRRKTMKKVCRWKHFTSTSQSCSSFVASFSAGTGAAVSPSISYFAHQMKSKKTVPHLPNESLYNIHAQNRLYSNYLKEFLVFFHPVDKLLNLWYQLRILMCLFISRVGSAMN